MNDKINLQYFVDLIAERHNLSKPDAEAFVDGFFSLIEEALTRDRLAKVKGLGTFKLVDVESRESMNIHTGERFVIDGYTKISFTPDNSLRALINRPFEHFDTVLLKDGVAFDDVSEAEEGSDDDADESNEDFPETNQENLEINQDFSEINQDFSEIDQDIPDASAGAVVEEAATAVETVAEETSEPEETAAAEETPEPEETPAEAEPEETYEPEDIPAEAEPETEAEPESEETPVDTPVEAEEAEGENSDGHETLEKMIAEAVEEKRGTIVADIYNRKADRPIGAAAGRGRGRGMRIFLNCFLVFVLVAILSCGYMVTRMYFPELFSDDNDEAGIDQTALDFRQIVQSDSLVESADTLATDTLLRDSLQADSIAQAAAQPSQEEPKSEEVKPVVVKEVRVEKAAETPKAVEKPAEQKPVAASATPDKSALNAPVHPDSVNYKIVGQKDTHVLQSGETLTRVSLRYYGTKDLYPYIVKYNNLTNPNSVPVGTTLKIPELVRR